MLLKLNPKADEIFRRLISGLNEVGDSKKIDNAPGAFMAVHVDYLGKPQFAGIHREARIFSVAHYYLQNGDCMADPDCEFLVVPDAVFVMTFQMANPPIYQRAVAFEDGRLLYSEKLQHQLCLFCCEWMTNIAEQQGL